MTREARTLCCAICLVVLALAAAPAQVHGDAPTDALLCANNQNPLSKILKLVRKIRANVNSLSQQVSANTEALAALEGKMDGAARSGSDEISKQLAELQSSVADIDANMQKLEAKLDDKVGASLEALVAQCQSNEQGIQQVQSGVGGLLTKSDDAAQTLDEILAQVAANGNDISNVESALSGLSDDAVLAAVATVEAKLDDEARFTDDAELLNLQGFVVANSNKMNWLNGQLQPLLVGITNKLGLPTTDISSQLEMIEGKLDDPSGLGAQLGAIEGKLDALSGDGPPPGP